MDLDLHARVGRLIDIYFEQRRALLDAGTPLNGWLVAVHPNDAAALYRAYRDAHNDEDHIEPLVPFPTFPVTIFGAEWHEDASVPVGEVRITVPEKP
jgi:hypothetical protein